MNDLDISLSKLITLVLWAWTLGVLAASWLALAAGHEELFEAFGFTACASSAVAATAQIRRYVLNVCSLLRARLVADDDRPQMHALR